MSQHGGLLLATGTAAGVAPSLDEAVAVTVSSFVDEESAIAAAVFDTLLNRLSKLLVNLLGPGVADDEDTDGMGAVFPTVFVVSLSR